MLEVTFVCSDPACAEERRVVVESLSDMAEVCDCGFGLQVIEVIEVQLV